MRRNVIVCFFVLLVALPATAQPRVDTIVAAFVFEGVSAFSHDRLLPLYGDWLGEPLTGDKQIRLERNLVSLYQRNGYLKPEVSVIFHPESPEVARVQVDEPRIREIRLSGVDGAQRRSLKTALALLMERRPVSQRWIDSVIQDVEQRLGVTLEASVQRTTTDNQGYVLLIDVNRARMGGELTYSAEGSQRLGQHLVRGEVSVYNPLPSVKEIYLSALHTLESDGYRSLGAGLVLPATNRDTVYLQTGFARAIPQDDPAGSNTVYRRQRHRLGWGHQLIDNSDWKAYLNGGVTVRDYTRKDAGDTEVDEQLRLADLGVRALHRRASTAHRFGTGIEIGVDSFGAKRRGSQADDEIDLSFQRIDAQYTYWRNLPVDFSFRLDLAAQYSPDNLPYSQRFSIGGSHFARAYEPGEFSGDSGIGSKVELRRGFNTNIVFQARLVPYVYYGLATAHENEDDDRDSAAAAGAGLRLLGREFSAYVEYGKPLTVESEYRDDQARLTGRLTLTF